jgi:hypothetical protein
MRAFGMLLEIAVLKFGHLEFAALQGKLLIIL